jgi:hypothetical protein
MTHNEFNFVSETVSDADIDLFLGPLEPTDGPFIRFPPTWTMAHVMHAAGIFKSVSEAKRNGWEKPISHGFQAITASKKKIRIFILNKIIG